MMLSDKKKKTKNKKKKHKTILICLGYYTAAFHVFPGRCGYCVREFIYYKNMHDATCTVSLLAIGTQYEKINHKLQNSNYLS